MATDLVSPVHGPDGREIGFVGVSVLVERIGRRLSMINFATRRECQIVDQNGTALFGVISNRTRAQFRTTDQALFQTHARKTRADTSKTMGRSIPPPRSSRPGGLTVVKQPSAVAYQPSARPA